MVREIIFIAQQYIVHCSILDKKLGSIFSDYIFHYIWHNRQNFKNIQDSFYSQFIERFKETPRPLSSNTKTITFLIKILNDLNINVTILGFHKNYTKTKKCLHKNQTCYSIFYAFQNYLSSLLFPNLYPDIIFCEFKSNVYIAHHIPHPKPILTLFENHSELHFQNQTLTKTDIISILKKETQHVHFPSSIAIYSSYHFVPNIQKWQPKRLESHIIGYYENKSSHDQLHIFLTPYLHSYDFSVQILPEKQTKHFVNIKNNIALSHVPEGISHPMSQHSASETILNETYCICQHPDTQFIPINPPKQYSHLGKNLFSFLQYSCYIGF